MKHRAAVLGTGQTHHRSKRTDVSIAGLCREAADRALADAGVAIGEIDAVVVGKAPDLFEGVMMPELYLADALGAVGKPMLRVHTAGSVGGATGIVAASLIQAGRASSGAGGGVREAVGVERDVGAVDLAALLHAGAGRRWRLLRAAHQVLHQAERSTLAHRCDGGRQGPPERRTQPVRAPEAGRQDGRGGTGLADAVGPGPLRRDLPVIGRCVRGRARRPGGGGGVCWAGGLDPGYGDADRADDVLRQGPREPAGRRRRRRGAVDGGRDHQPDRPGRRGRDLRAVLLVRADVAGEPRVSLRLARDGG